MKVEGDGEGKRGAKGRKREEKERGRDCRVHVAFVTRYVLVGRTPPAG